VNTHLESILFKHCKYSNVIFGC